MEHKYQVLWDRLKGYCEHIFAPDYLPRMFILDEHRCPVDICESCYTELDDVVKLYNPRMTKLETLNNIPNALTVTLMKLHIIIGEYDKTELNTVQLSELFNIKQQSVSRHLIELDKLSLVDRHDHSTTITVDGYMFLSKIGVDIEIE